MAEIDPDIAQLMGIEPVSDGDDAPDFSDLFGEEGGGSNAADTSKKSFSKPAAIKENPKPWFRDKDFYKKVLTGEGEAAKKMHEYLTKFMTVTDAQERSVYRARIIPVFWELVGGIAPKLLQAGMDDPKRIFVRFASLLPSILSPAQLEMLSTVIMENSSGEPIWYMDEWLKAVALGQVNPSATDELKPQKGGRGDGERYAALIDKTRGRYETQLAMLRSKISEIDSLELLLAQKVGTIRDHETRPDVGLMRPYNEGQRSAFNEMSDIIRRLAGLNKEITTIYSEHDDLKKQLDDLREKSAAAGEASAVDTKIAVSEANSLRQMAKLCVGRQGNHFPILLKQYVRDNILDVVTRENAINLLMEVETLDPGLFLRTFKNTTHRIVPNVLLLPCYGDEGVCWEPFERFNRSTSRGRIAIPMYPKDPRTAVIAALADLRWQVAKEKAQHYWMEEGLTGWYYQYFTERKLKGDVKETFIQDYILWITKESEGTQKLERDARAVFWRWVPFPQDVKEKLRNRGFLYAELYKKDQNRAMSDGY